MRFDLEKLSAAVHKDLDYSLYESTLIRNDTNCYTHAIGATSICEKLRIGEISGHKEIDKDFYSQEEVEKSFMEDMKVLGLKCEKMTFAEKTDKRARNERIIQSILDTKISDDQYIVILFVYHDNEGNLYDFHFWRYDNANQFTDKRAYGNVCNIENPIRSFLDNEFSNVEFVGSYLIQK